MRSKKLESLCLHCAASAEMSESSEPWKPLGVEEPGSCLVQAVWVTPCAARDFRAGRSEMPSPNATFHCSFTWEPACRFCYTNGTLTHKDVTPDARGHWGILVQATCKHTGAQWSKAIMYWGNAHLCAMYPCPVLKTVKNQRALWEIPL